MKKDIENKTQDGTEAVQPEKEIVASESVEKKETVAPEASESSSVEVVENEHAPQDADQDDEKKKQEMIKYLEELAKQGKKLIPARALTEDEIAKLQFVMNDLEALKKLVFEKREDALAKDKTIEQTIDVLVKADFIKVDEAKAEQSREGTRRYAELLTNIGTEIDLEVNHARSLTEIKDQKAVIAWLHEPNDFDSYVNHRVKFIKKYIRSVKRDLMVSYSRFCVGFDDQMKHLGHLKMIYERGQKLEALKKKQEKK